MEKLIEVLRQHIRQNPPDYGDVDSVLDTLYWHYVEHGSTDSEKIINQFAVLRKLVNIPPEEYDQVFYVVSDLCLEHGRLAFFEGLRVGIELAMEVNRGEEASK